MIKKKQNVNFIALTNFKILISFFFLLNFSEKKSWLIQAVNKVFFLNGSLKWMFLQEILMFDWYCHLNIIKKLLPEFKTHLP